MHFYVAQVIPQNKGNLTQLVTNCRFEDFSWMLPQATDNFVAGHVACQLPIPGLYLSHLRRHLQKNPKPKT